MRSPARRGGRLWLIAAFCLAACGSTAPGATTTPRTGAHVGDVAPTLAGTSLEGRSVSLTSMHGAVVVLVFWASWCAPCQAEQPAVNRLAREQGASGVRFLGVSVDVDRSAAQGYVTRFAVPYDSLIDSAQTVVVDFDVAGPPTTFVIDGAGRVAAELVGELNPADLGARISSARAAR